ncbi:hypothetical protein RZN25_13505 [Bacillaceae bacterium S4-13-56]
MKKLIISIISFIMFSVWSVALFLIIEEDKLIVGLHSSRSTTSFISYEKGVMKDFVTSIGSQNNRSDTTKSYEEDGRVSIDQLLDALHLVK